MLIASLALTSSAVRAQDITALGRDVRVNAADRVGDVMSMGGNALILGHAEGDLITLGGNAEIGGTVEGDVMSMGGAVVVRGRVEGDVVSHGGAVRVEGVVEGDVTSRGGDVYVEGHVHGDVHPTGGQLTLGSGGRVHGDSMPARAKPDGSAFGALIRGAGFALIFLLALLVRSLWRSRFDAIRRALVREPTKASLLGLVGVLGALVGMLGLAVTIVGLPVAAVLGVVAFVAGYAGLAVAASVLGAALPIQALSGHEAGQIAAGVLALYVASLVPVLGNLVLVCATVWGLGGLLLTRDRGPGATGDGPYRTAAR